MAFVPSERPALRFADILENIDLIQVYAGGMDWPAFQADRMRRDAIERCLQRISEAAVKLGTRAEQLAPGPPWQAIRALGNVLRHAYDQVEPQRMWEIITRDLPTLRAAVVVAKTSLVDENNTAPGGT
jgi:uncharacterized protein with HEPN domain